MNWESSFGIYTLPDVKKIASGVVCDDLERWDGRGVRRLWREEVYVYL